MRRGAEDLLRRKGMMAMPGTEQWSPAMGSAMPGGSATGPAATPFAHHSAGPQRSRGQSPLAVAHDLVPGHRHRGAEQHSALSGH
jgi:hypothetical protein